MNREFFIKALCLLLVVLAVSPACRALGVSSVAYESTEMLTMRGTVVAIAPSAGDSSYALPPAEHACWFQAAHVFESTPAQLTPIILPLLLAVLTIAFAAGLASTRLATVPLWKLPDRSPPRSQPYLQVFRI